MIPTHLNDRPTLAPHPPHPRKAKASPPSAKAPAKRSLNDRTASAPLPLSPREQQVCEYLAQGITFETIARHLNCSLAAAIEYYRRALAKLQPAIANAVAPLEQGDRNATAQPKPTSAEPPRDRPSSASASICERSPFHCPAVVAPASLERPNPLDLYVSSLFVMGESVADPNPGYIDVKTCPINPLALPEPFQPRRRKRTSRRERRTGVGFRVAAAS